jgi:predicted nucleic acid-binding protein
MDREETIRAVLDANVLYSAFLRDVLLRLAAENLFSPYWSNHIHEEWTRNLLRHRADLSPAALARTRASMDAHFPGALVTGQEVLEGSFDGVAPEDRHVAATALLAGAKYIITHNLRDFPARALLPHGIQATNPDAFVARLVASDSVSVHSVLELHRRSLARPALMREQYRNTFVRNGLTRSASLLWSEV